MVWKMRISPTTRDARGQHISQLIAPYWRIEDAKQRRRVLGLIHSLADQADAPKLHTQPRRAKLSQFMTRHIDGRAN
jgi:hypothetical protein